MAADAAQITDQMTRNAEAVKWLPMAYKIARDYWRAGPGKRLGGIDDGFQIAAMALLRAIELYHPGRVKFVTYAYACVRWRLHNAAELRRYWSAEPLSDKLLAKQEARPVGDRRDIEELLGGLEPREREIIERHFLAGERLHEIAQTLGISKQRCSQIKQCTLAKLRRNVDS